MQPTHTYIANSINSQIEALSFHRQMEHEYAKLITITIHKKQSLLDRKKTVTNHRELMYLSIENAMHRLQLSDVEGLAQGSFKDDNVHHSHVFDKGKPATAIKQGLPPSRLRPVAESKWPSTNRTATIVSTMATDIPCLYRDVLHMLAVDIALISDRQNHLRGYSRPIAALACLIFACRAVDFAPCLVLGRKVEYFGLHHNAAISASNILWRHQKEFCSVIREHDGEMQSLERRPTRADLTDRSYATVDGEISKALAREKREKKREERRPRIFKPSPLRMVQSVSDFEDDSQVLRRTATRMVPGDLTPQLVFDRSQRLIDARGPSR